MLANLSGWHFLIIVVVVLLLFGSAKLPALARSVGQSMKVFKNEIKPEMSGLKEEIDGVRQAATDSTTVEASSSADEAATTSR